MTWLIDGHEDLAFNAVALGRDLTRPVAEIRRAEGEPPAHGEGTATGSLPALRAGPDAQELLSAAQARIDDQLAEASAIKRELETLEKDLG